MELDVSIAEEKNSKFYYQGIPYTGKLNEFYEGGALRSTVICKNGNLVSPYKELYKSGAIEQITHFDNNGKKKEIGYYENGNIQFEVEYSNRKKILRKDFYPSGKLKNLKPYKFVQRYNGDVPHGVETTYNEFGQKVKETIWEYGLPNGTHDF
ncbi:MAG: hypothetical protein JXQ26_09260 [Tissierellales bacterium]|nr:hypothetical protein [Tissierellales bacterium]